MALKRYGLSFLLLGPEDPLLGCVNRGSSNQRRPIDRLGARNVPLLVNQNVDEYLHVNAGLAGQSRHSGCDAVPCAFDESGSIQPKRSPGLVSQQWSISSAVACLNRSGEQKCPDQHEQAQAHGRLNRAHNVHDTALRCEVPTIVGVSSRFQLHL